MFGSWDDPAEQAAAAWWESSTLVSGGLGLSLIGPQWRGATRLHVDSRRPGVSARLGATIRPGIYGTYEPDTDEWRDLVRAIEFIRFQSAASDQYLRIGPLDRTRFGNGHLVNFFSSQAAWDERTVGAEARLRGDRVDLQAFASDVTRADLMGARLSLRASSRRGAGLRSLELAVAIAGETRVQTSAAGQPSAPFAAASAEYGVEADVRMTAWHNGSFDFVPFVSAVRLPGFGQGLMFGASLENANFIDIARLHTTLALQYNSADFRPGYFGAFYTVSEGLRAIVGDAGSEAVIGDGNPNRANVPLRAVERGNSIMIESRLHIFDRFELLYAFQRYHGVQRLSEYHLRLFFRTPSIILSVAQDRRGLKGFTSLFGDLGEENRLRFQFDVRIVRTVWMMIDAHYTYRHTGESELGQEFAIQRRFDPVLGFRARF